MQNQTLGKYHILEEIGRGGFATVYRAEDTALGREVALKVLDPLLMRDRVFVTRFLQEAQAAARLEHPHIIPIYEIGEDHERLYIAMRLVRGGSLATQLERRARLRWEEALRILREICDALSYAHEQGVIHRDIKPHNILLDERSGALLSDFGFARLIGTSSMSQSMSGGIVGTPAYIAPEIWEGEKAGPATDVYALGCVLYETLLGQTLFGGETPMAVMHAHDVGAQLPDTWPLDAPSGIHEVLQKALARRVHQRYASVGAFWDALQALQTAAEKERLANEVTRLFAEMRAADAEGQWSQAAALGRQLLELQPQHQEGAALLGQVQARLVRQQALSEQLATKYQKLATQQRAQQEEKARLDQALSDLTARREMLAQQVTELERQLAEVKAAQQACESEGDRLQTETRAYEKREVLLAQQAEHLKVAEGLLTQGDLDRFEWLLKESATTSGARTDLRRTIVTGNAPQLQRLYLLRGHTQDITGLAFAPDGEYLLSASADGGLRLWRTLDGRMLWEAYLGIGPASSIAYAPTAQYFAAGYANGQVKIWKLRGAKTLNDPTLSTPLSESASEGAAMPPAQPLQRPRRGIPVTGAVHALHFTADASSLLALHANGMLRRLQLPAHQILAETQLDFSLRVLPLKCADIEPALQLAACGDNKGVITIWNLEEHRLLQSCKHHIRPPLCLGFSPNGELLLSGGFDCTAHLWRVADGKLLLSSRTEAPLKAVAFSANGKLLAVPYNARFLNFFETEKGDFVHSLETPTGVTQLAFCKSRALLAVGLADGVIQLWGA